MADGQENQVKLLVDARADRCEGPDQNGSPTSDSKIANENEAHTETEEVKAPPKQCFKKRFIEDVRFRHKFVHTMVLCWSFITYGWIAGMTGPTFPDLGQIIQENLATSTWLFTVGSFGFMVGSMGGGALFDRFNKVALMAASLFGMAVFQSVTPYCTKLPIMMGARFLVGVFCGVLDTGGNADIYYVWGKDGGSYMQALHFAFSFGALLAPLATGPFLAKKIDNCGVVSSVNTTNTTQSSFDVDNTLDVFSVIHNDTNITEVTNDNVCVEAYEDSNVHYAFILSAILCLTSAIGFVCLLCDSKYVYTHTKKMDEEEQNKYSKRKKLTLSQKVVFLILVCVQISSYSITEDTFASFLMTFCLTHLDWSKTDGSYLTSAFWISFATGRFLGIFITRWLKQEVLLAVYLTISTVALVGLYICAKFYYIPMIWITIIVLGFGMSIVFPAFFSYTTEKIIPVKGKVSSMIFTCIVVVGMGFPVLMGNVMERYGSLWFVYILLISMVYCLVHYVVLSLLVKVVLRVDTKEGDSSNKINETEMSLIK